MRSGAHASGPKHLTMSLASRVSRSGTLCYAQATPGRLIGSERKARSRKGSRSKFTFCQRGRGVRQGEILVYHVLRTGKVYPS